MASDDTPSRPQSPGAESGRSFSRVSCSYDEGEEEERSEASSEEEAEISERDQLIHWWCRKQLGRCLKKLCGLPEAAPFLEPLPWKELGLEDFLEVVENPVDLKTIGDRLENGEYEDDDGCTNPDFFWEDIMLIWENCKLYYEGDENSDAYRMADEMQIDAEAMEEEFWAELDRFEKGMETISGNMANVAAVADVAASHVEDKIRDAAMLAEDLTRTMANWWWGGTEPSDQGQLAAPAKAEASEGRSIMKAESPVAKGKVTIVFEDGVPIMKSKREDVQNNLVSSLAGQLDVHRNELAIDWEQVWVEPEHLKAAAARATGNKDLMWTTIDVVYRVNLDIDGDPNDLLEDLEEIADMFNNRHEEAAVEIKNAIGNKVEVIVHTMTVCKTSRKPLPDHYLDLIMESTRLNSRALEERVGQDLQEIEDELQEALRKLLPVIKEIDNEDDKDAHFEFPEAHKKVPLHQLSGPQLQGGPGDGKRFGRGKDSRRSSFTSRGSSMRSDRSNHSEVGTPRSEVSAVSHGSKTRPPRVSLVPGFMHGTSSMSRTKSGKLPDADLLKSLVGDSSDGASDDSADTQREAKPDVDKLRSIYRARTRSAGERNGKDAAEGTRRARPAK